MITRMSKKLKVAVLYGGKSTEHEVSVHSARPVCAELIASGKYEVISVFIDRDGKWFLQRVCGPKTQTDQPITPVISQQGNLFLPLLNEYLQADVFFPVLHGTNGEDGTLQGLLESMDVPYTGCGVLASAMGMDKELSKLAAERCGVPTLPYKKLSRSAGYNFESLTSWAAEMGYPLFVKPVRLGSSVGVTKVKSADTLRQAVDFAFRFDSDVLVEKGVENAREIFCGLFGEGETVRSSECGELKTLKSEFFDYQAKYITEGGCETRVPADLPTVTQDLIRRQSRAVFKELGGCGLARVDFLMDGNGKAWFSEINTLPGMSHTSLYPQLFEASGLAYGEILDGVIKIAFDVYARKKKLSLERSE